MLVTTHKSVTARTMRSSFRYCFFTEQPAALKCLHIAGMETKKMQFDFNIC